VTPAQRLSQALYGYHDEVSVKAARGHVQRLNAVGYAIVPVEISGAMWRAGYDADPSSADPNAIIIAAIRAYQQEIEAE
jgi:hypothetical protein